MTTSTTDLAPYLELGIVTSAILDRLALANFAPDDCSAFVARFTRRKGAAGSEIRIEHPEVVDVTVTDRHGVTVAEATFRGKRAIVWATRFCDAEDGI